MFDTSSVSSWVCDACGASLAEGVDQCSCGNIHLDVLKAREKERVSGRQLLSEGWRILSDHYSKDVPAELEELTRGFLKWAKDKADAFEASLSSEVGPERDWYGIDWEAMANDEGCFGAGLCAEASADLAHWCNNVDKRRRALPAGGNVGREHLSHYPWQHFEEPHWVCLIVLGNQTWAVDLTARQFGAELPFPWFWRYNDPH